MVASLLNEGATIKLTGSPMGCKRDLCPPPGHQNKISFFGPGGPEVKFSLIAPYFGDQKLHVPGWFLLCFGSVLAAVSPDYDQIMKIIKIVKNDENRPL